MIQSQQRGPEAFWTGDWSFWRLCSHVIHGGLEAGSLEAGGPVAQRCGQAETDPGREARWRSRWGRGLLYLLAWALGSESASLLGQTVFLTSHSSAKQMGLAVSNLLPLRLLCGVHHLQTFHITLRYSADSTKYKVALSCALNVLLVNCSHKIVQGPGLLLAGSI